MEGLGVFVLMIAVGGGGKFRARKGSERSVKEKWFYDSFWSVSEL